MKCRLMPVALIVLFTGVVLNVNAQTEIRSDITENTTWEKAGSPYILIGTTRQVAEGVTLIIEPGVVVKFSSWGNVFLINGHLEADGKPLPHLGADPIIFTSYKDDQHGGDSNNNGDADSPASGDWKSIQIAGKGSAFFRSCEFLYGGYWGNPMLDIYAEIDTIWNCRFAESNSSALSVNDYSLRVYNSEFRTGNGIQFLTSTNYQGNPKELIVRNNTFEVDYQLINAGYGDSVRIILESNNLVRSKDTYQANVCTVFGSITGYCYFKSQNDIPFLFSTLAVAEGSSLILPPGTVVKMEQNTNFFIEGSLWAIGEKDAPIVFTSIYDDKFGGDSDGVNSPTEPEAGIWGYMEFKGTNDSSRLDNVIIKYAGQWDPGIEISNSNVLFKNCVVTETGSYAFQINGASPEIAYSTISNNNYGISVNYSGNPFIHHNDFMVNRPGFDNGNGLVVDNLNPGIIKAENNYWGSATGPKQYTYNPDGSGNVVIGPVDYEPFSTEMINEGLVSKPKLRIDKDGTTVSCRELSAYNFTDILWEFGDGETSSDNSPDHTYSDVETYEVCYTATSNYGVKVKQCTLVDLSTSTRGVDENMAWSVFPNPSDSKIFCSGFSGKEEEFTLNLLNVSGRLVKNLYSNRIKGGEYRLEFDLKEIPSGVYFIQKKSGDFSQVKKIVIH